MSTSQSILQGGSESQYNGQQIDIDGNVRSLHFRAFSQISHCISIPLRQDTVPSKQLTKNSQEWKNVTSDVI